MLNSCHADFSNSAELIHYAAANGCGSLVGHCKIGETAALHVCAAWLVQLAAAVFSWIVDAQDMQMPCTNQDMIEFQGSNKKQLHVLPCRAACHELQPQKGSVVAVIAIAAAQISCVCGWTPGL